MTGFDSIEPCHRRGGMRGERRTENFIDFIHNTLKTKQGRVCKKASHSRAIKKDRDLHNNCHIIRNEDNLLHGSFTYVKLGNNRDKRIDPINPSSSIG